MERAIKVQRDVIERMGLEVDEMKELRDELWALGDGCAEDVDEGLEEGEQLGEDEEY